MAITGKKKEALITWEEILQRSNNGFDVFRADIGAFPLSRPFHSPLRTDENPSFGVFNKGGVWMYKDQGSGEVGTALQYIQKRYGLSFKDAIEHMANVLGISNTNTKYKPIKIDWKAPEINKEDVQISFSPKHWEDEHFEFWDGTGVDEKHAEKYNAWMVKDLAVARRKVNIKPKEVVIAYYAEDIDRVKVYFPEREKGNRFKGNAPGDYLWNFHAIQKDWSTVRIQKSYKDLLVSTVINPECIATQNESAISLLEHNYDNLQAIEAEKIVCFGNDPHAWMESYLITYLTSWSYFNMPDEEDTSINDEYAFAKKYGIKKLEELYRKKGII